jgi:hypothetical protein
MRKEKKYFNSAKSKSAVVWRPDIPTHYKPVIKAEIIRNGVRLYRDDAGKFYDADVVDKMFGVTETVAPAPPRHRSGFLSFKPSR